MVERAGTKSTHGAEVLKRIAKKSISGVDLALCRLTTLWHADVPTEADAQRAFEALADGGSIQMPLGKTFGLVTDRFGQPRRVEAERLSGHAPTNPGSRKTCSWSLHPLERHPGRGACRQQHDCSGGGWYEPLHPFIAQVQLLRRPGIEDEHVVGQGGWVEFKGRRRTIARCRQANPLQPVARCGGLEREDLVSVQGPDRVVGLRLHLSHHLCPRTLYFVRTL